jgi:L-serine dehydratase
VRFTAFDAGGGRLAERTFYSIGGGFVTEEGGAGDAGPTSPEVVLPHAFHSGAELLGLCRAHGLSISALMLENESARRPVDELWSGLSRIWEVMKDCVERGCATEGTLPGGLGVRRRAPELFRQLRDHPERGMSDPLTVLDWVCLYALAVSEENAAGGRVVTAPTNGAAGIIPAVLHYYRRFVPGATDRGVSRLLLTAGAIGSLFKENASISGAEVGCQGEVGSACSMAAGGLAEALGGTPDQVANAAEIAMEHNLGLTCDPVRGLVQVPCIERNAMAAVKAINAARLALRGEGEGLVSLDKVIWTMRETGRDMRAKYKETAQGGLALTAPDPEFTVGLAEC